MQRRHGRTIFGLWTKPAQLSQWKSSLTKSGKTSLEQISGSYPSVPAQHCPRNIAMVSETISFRSRATFRLSCSAVSSTVLELEDSQIALLDAGEGTSGQLARHYGHGPAGLSDFYSRLRLVFISHMHADHHSGLAALLSSRSQTLLLADGSASDKLEPLYIACPPQTRTYIRDMNALHSLGLDNAQVPVEFVDCHHLLEKKREDSRYASLYSALLLKKAETVLVEHRTKAFGLVLEGETGWKIV